jgi:hypothetical protein
MNLASVEHDVFDLRFKKKKKKKKLLTFFVDAAVTRTERSAVSTR